MEGEGNERKFILSFSSEEPYDRWYGTEILDHSESAVDLTRINEIGVLLFNHDRDKVLGKINRAWLENSRGMAEVEFDKDADSDLIYQKVAGGTLKGVSVGYVVDVWEEVMPNKQSEDGRFTGPVDIAKKWTPYEISIVSVPADPTVGVGRELDETTAQGKQTRSLDWYERQLQINKNIIMGGNKE
jgi:HK97 family phage prohead protease